MRSSAMVGGKCWWVQREGTARVWRRSHPYHGGLPAVYIVPIDCLRPRFGDDIEPWADDIEARRF